MPNRIKYRNFDGTYTLLTWMHGKLGRFDKKVSQNNQLAIYFLPQQHRVSTHTTGIIEGWPPLTFLTLNRRYLQAQVGM